MRRMTVATVLLLGLAGCGSGSHDTAPSYTGPAVHVRECASAETGDPIDLEAAAQAYSDRLSTLELDGTVEVVDDGCIEVVIHYPTRAEADAAAAQMEQDSKTYQVYVRPVVGGCQALDAAVSGSTGDLGLPASDPASTQYLRLLGDPVQLCLVGPALATGEIFSSSALAELINGAWGVTAGLRDGGLEEWNAAAAECFDHTAVCPTGQLAIELDGVIQTAPTVNSREFESSVQITGDFTESEARALARAINAGSLPVQLVVESITVTG